MGNGEISKYDDIAAAIARKDKALRDLADSAEAQMSLLCCYRVGKRPTEALLARLSKVQPSIDAARKEATA